MGSHLLLISLEKLSQVYLLRLRPKMFRKLLPSSFSIRWKYSVRLAIRQLQTIGRKQVVVSIEN